MMQLQQHHQEVEEEEEEASNSSSHHHHHNKASPSPSFSSYSSETLAEIAARVIEELSRDPSSLSDDDDALFPPWENQNDSFVPQNDEPTEQNHDDDDFEFAFVSRDFASPVSADDIFYNGQIKPMYPIFGVVVPSNDAVSSVVPNNNNNNNIATSTPRRRLPLRKLMFEEGETASCSSSTEESVDLEGVVAAEGAYCVWTPNSVGRERKKSNSTGSASKRWKLRVRDLLLRSHSDGKDSNKQQQQQQQQQQKELKEVVFQIPKNKVAAKPQNGTEQVEQNKRKSFLPYKPELVGLFANVNGLGRNLRPF